jgi:beta-glucosidase
MGKRVSDWPTGNIVQEMPSKSISTGSLSHSDEFLQISLNPAPKAVFHEGLAIDYKWFDKRNIEPRWEFGHGMRYAQGWYLQLSRTHGLTCSYTTFAMSNLTLISVHIKDYAAIQETNERYEGTAGLYDILVGDVFYRSFMN